MHLIVHPVLGVRRDARGSSQGGRRRCARRTLESWQMMEIDRPRDEAQARELERRLHAALEDVRRAVADFRRMLERVRAVANELERAACRCRRSHAGEARALLSWMHDGHFVFLGYRYYRLKRGRSRDALVRDADSGLGILRDARRAQAPAAHRADRPSAPPGARARTAGAHQGEHAVDRASRQLPRLRRRQDLRRRRAMSAANIASSACGPRARITRRPRRSRCCGASSRR